MNNKILLKKVAAKLQKKLLKPNDFYPNWKKLFKMVEEGIIRDLKERFDVKKKPVISVNKKFEDGKDTGYLVIRINGEDFDNNFYYKGSKESIEESTSSHGSLPEYKDVLDPGNEEFDDLLYDAVQEREIYQALDQFWHTRKESDYFNNLEKFADKNLK